MLSFLWHQLQSLIFKTSNMKIQYWIIALLCLIQLPLHAQINLPTSRTSWTSEPTGWTDMASGAYTSGFACTNDNMAKFANTGDFIKVAFNAAADTVKFSLKSTSLDLISELKIEESIDDSSYTVLATIKKNDFSNCVPIKLNPNATSRYIKWSYTKSAGNLGLDDVEIYTASASTSCGITDIALTNAGTCNNNNTPNDPADDYFTADVQITYENNPTTGQVVLSGDDVVGGTTSANVSGSVQTITGVHLKASGSDVSITAGFSDETACTLTKTMIGSAVSSCSAPCTASLNFTSTTCEAKTVNTDSYTAELAFDIGSETGTFNISTTHGNLASSTIDATGTITITGIPEDASPTVEVVQASSSCTLSIVVNAPVCNPFSIEPGVIINEFSQVTGIGASAEWVECLVTGTPGTTVDLRKWIFDDNNGDFSGNAGNKSGLARGYIRFSDNCTWEKVPVGSVIVFYNAEAATNGGLNMKTRYGLADDPTDSNFDFLYVVPIDGQSSDYFEGVYNETGSTPYSGTTNCSGASNAYDQTTFYAPKWAAVGYRNGGDATQIRKADMSYFQGISYGTTGDNACTGIAINHANHPDYAARGTDANYFATSSGDHTFRFMNTNDNDYRSKSNWSISNAQSDETPGTGNSTANQDFINSLRGSYPSANADQSYTCLLRANETRMFWNNADEILLWIKNNGATNHGSSTATLTVQSTDINADKQNVNLADSPYFMDWSWSFVPTTSTGADYTVRLYTSGTAVQSFVDHVNTKMGLSLTAAELLGKMKLYKFATSDNPYTANSAISVTPTVQNFTFNGDMYYTFEASFTSFSQFKLGAPPQALPVEYSAFRISKKEDKVLLNWITASEENNDYFEIERSADARNFKTIGRIDGKGTSFDTNSYSFVDSKPKHGVNCYRLKQVDFNGTENLTDIKSVYFDRNSSAFKLYPTLANNEIHIHFNNQDIQHAVIIIDAYGKIVQRILAKTNRIQVNISNLVPGTYFVRYGNSTHRFIKVSSF